MFWIKKQFLAVVLMIQITVSVAIVYPSYPTCTDTNLDNSGLYFTERNGIRYWNHCGFPNSRISSATCSRNNPLGNLIHDFCNIEGLMSNSEADVIDSSLAKIAADTSYHCTTDAGLVLNTTVQVVAVGQASVTSLMDHSQICENNCGQYFPEITDAVANPPSQEELEFAVDIFAQRLADSWQNSVCDALVVIVLCENQKTIGTGVSSKLTSKLTWDEIQSIRTETYTMFSNENTTSTDVLVHVLNKYHNELIDIPPAYWLLLIMFILLTSLFLFAAWQFNGGGISGQFEESVLSSTTSLALRVVTGLIMVEMLLRFMLVLDEVLRPWHLIVFGGAITAVFIVLIVTAA